MSTKLTLAIQAVFLCCLTLLCTRVRAQEVAEIVNLNAEGCLQYESDALGNFIPDFSYAGYRNGEVPIPTVATVLTISPVAGDNTAHIQAAIDEVAARTQDQSGIRGAVELAAGTYPMAGSLLINADGVVLRGVGQGDDPATNTIIVGEGNMPASRDLITVGGASFVSWNSAVAGTRSDITSPIVPAGARTIQVDNPGLYQVGDNVIVTHPSTNEWLETINFGDTGADAPWVAGQLDMIYNRYITAINAATGQITLDVPIYDRLDRSLSQSELYVLNEPDIRRNSGVENLRIEVASSGALNEDHVRTAILLEGVEDVWVTDVTALRFSYAAVNTEVATRVTVKGCSGLTPHSPITGGRRYNFASNFQSNNILFTECTGSDGRHTFVCNAASTGSGIVFHNSSSTGDLSASEGHRRWSQALLFDNIRFTESATSTLLGLYNRGSFGTGHGWSAVHSVAWNVSVPFPRFILLQRPPGRQNYAIGCNAMVTNDGTFDFPIGYSELTNEQPAITSIYETQLAKRLELGALPDPPASVTAFDYPDNVEVNWFDVSAEETGYEVFISLDGGTTFNSLATVPADVTTYTHEVVHATPELVRYRVVAQRNNCTSPPSAHALIMDPPVDPAALFVTYFEQDTLPEINLGNSAGAVSTFTLNEDCETLAISVTDPTNASLRAFDPYVIRVRDDMGNAITDITDRVNLSMRVRTAEPVNISALFRSGGGGSDERSGRLDFTVPGDTTEWTQFTLAFGPDDLAGFNPADLRDCWFYLDRGEENFNGNEIFFDYIAIAGEADEERFSSCSLAGANQPIFAEYFTADSLSSVNVNSAAGVVTTFNLDTECETLGISVTDPINAPLPEFNAYQIRATDAAGDPISDISEGVSVNFRVRSAESVVVDFLFRSGGGSTSERSSRKTVTVPSDLDNWSVFTLTWEPGELEGFDPTDLRDLWMYLDRGEENFNGNEIYFDHVLIGGEGAEDAFSPCSLEEVVPTAFFEYFTADDLASTSVNLSSAAGTVTTFDLDTDCETLGIAITDPVNAPLGGFSAYQIRATDENGDPISDISTSVSVNFRARSAAEVAVDFLFRSGEGGSDERSGRKSVTVPGDLDNWSEFTLTWEAGELDGFDPTDLRDLWVYLDRGDENFNGNNFIFDHIVIGNVADEAFNSPCSLGPEPVTFFEYFTADTITETSLNVNSSGAMLTTFGLDTECETLSIAVTDPVNAPLGGFSPYQFRATDENGDPILDISMGVSVSFRARSEAEVVVDFLFRSGAGGSDERSGRKSVTVPGDLDNWSAFTLTWEAGDLEGFDPTDLRDLWVYLDRGDDNFNGNNFIFDHIVIGGVADEAFNSPCPVGVAAPTAFFEYFMADDLESTSVNLNSTGALVTTFDLDTDCETLSISVTDPATAPLSAFSPYILNPTDSIGDDITNITDIVTVTVRVRSAAEVVLDFLFRSGGGGNDERSGRKSVTIPGDLDNWSEFTLSWEAGELEGFDPADLRDLWMYLDRGDDNFNGNEVIFDHIVIGGTPDEAFKSPCFLTNTNDSPELASVSVFPNPTQHTLSIRSDQPTALVGWELIDGQGRVLAFGDNVRIPIQIGAFPQGMYVLRITGQNGGFVYRRIIKL